MGTKPRRTLDEYLALQYPFNAVADEEGGYVVVFPDLPGCMTQVETIDEIPEMAEEVWRLWIGAEYEMGRDIPLPSYPEEYSGKFVVRLPRSLHRELAEAAAREGVSLNQYVVALLARRDVQARLEGWLEQLGAWLAQGSAAVDRGVTSPVERTLYEPPGTGNPYLQKAFEEWKNANEPGDSGNANDKKGSSRGTGGAAGRPSRRRGPG